MFKKITTHPQNPDVKEITCEELSSHTDTSGINLIDVRESDEYIGELGHIKSAELLPLGSLEKSIEKIDGTKPTVFICRSGGRSARAALFAQEHLKSDCFNLIGGMIRWNELSLPTEK